MTYALGWKTESEVFLAADTAITTRGDNVQDLDRPKSSFGQQHIKEEKRKVEERDVKLHLKNNVGITFAGDVSLAREIVKAFYDELDKGKSPTDALNWAINLHAPTPSDRKVKIIVGYYEKGHPCLVTFNSKDDHVVRNNEVLVQIGSIPQAHRNFTEISLSHILPDTVHQPKLQLASMLGIFQIYGVFDDLMNHGVGGAVGGLYIDETGGRWQPDLLFLFEDKLVSTCFREDCFAVSSPTIAESRCFLGYIPPKSEEEIRQQTSSAVEQAKALRKEGKFDYVVVIGEKPGVTLVDMAKNQKHAFLWIEPFEKEGRTGTRIARFPELEAIVNNDKAFFKNVAYMEPTIQKIPEDKIIKSKIGY
ncbi:hypothetical protein K8942_01290 [Candidatus Peribacteria bacterium]|nr:MAG: hypothetical protein K8942_01290 [Candidatus Peribacteria bacterium]